jgi:pyridinium-3,5-bisthiocarboxylic acid mononucleotide nickel chelatase
VSGAVLYIDPWSGVSGDMFLAALLDADRQSGRLEVVLRSAVDALGLEGTTIEVTRDVEWGVDCTRVHIDDGEAAPLRRLQEMEQVIGGAALSWQVRERALAAVRRLAEVEAAVHGCAIEDIHFHEIGAVDTLVDIVGSFALVEALGIQQVHVGTIPVGGGTVEIAHGVMGVPAPATVRLLEGYPIVGGPEARELTTPTGELLVGQLQARPGSLPIMRPERVGYGAGNLKLDRGPNVLRMVVGTAVEPAGERDSVVELQTNLDDVSPEVIGHAAAALLAAGALDVWTAPVQMKKGRPGVVLHALVSESAEDAAVRLIFEETGTLGIRRASVKRHVAERGVVKVEVGGVSMDVKWGKWGGRIVSVSPEYEDCARVAGLTGISLKDVNRLAAEAARKLVSDGPARG